LLNGKLHGDFATEREADAAARGFALRDDTLLPAFPLVYQAAHPHGVGAVAIGCIT